MIALSYHDRTKHHFSRFARAPGYLDWANQPDPFRRYAGAPCVPLPRLPVAAHVPYSALFDESAAPMPLDLNSLGEFLRCSAGLSAWKRHGQARWALRVNPSSGNLHPTEVYLIHDARVFHYAPAEHALEERCRFDDGAFGAFVGTPGAAVLVGLTSIHWREAWKYGERAFRYCQHDVGHALGALRLAAAMLGWRLALLPRWSDDDIGRLFGVDRGFPSGDVEREEPECVAVVTAADPVRWTREDPAAIMAAVDDGVWQGAANRLSPAHVDWPVIEEVALATRYPGCLSGETAWPHRRKGETMPAVSDSAKARDVVLARRSAQAFDGIGVLGRELFRQMLRRLGPSAPPWDACGWPPQVHLVFFVHRVEGLLPGIYACLRDETVRSRWQRAMRAEFLWEQVDSSLYLLVPVDATAAAMRLACDQAIASDGFFSLAMVADVESSLRERGEWFYRRLFWECGLIGQVLYLEAVAAGARATGIGCFYDDPVHELLGLSGHEWQSLYHFSMGAPVEDDRLTTEPGYRWEVAAPVLAPSRAASSPPR